jgi:uncharacterized protein (TIRG00374 family)
VSNESPKTAGGRLSGNIKIAAGIVISAVFLYFAARNVDFRKIPGTIANVNFTLYGLSILVYLVSFYVKALQVKIMLGFRSPVGSWSLAAPIVIGYYCNNIFPLKAGEVVRTSLIARKKSLPFWSVFSAMLLERSFDLVFVLLIALATSFFTAFPPEVNASIRGFVIFLIVAYGVFITLAVLARTKRRAPAILEKLLPTRVRTWLWTTIERLAEGLWAVKKPLPLAGTFSVGLLFWMINLLGYWLRLEAFGLPSSFPAVGVFIVVVGLGVSIPSAPSYVGVFHLLVVFALGVFGVSKDTAFSFALFSHALDFVIVALLGNAAIVTEGITMKLLRKSAGSLSEKYSVARGGSRPAGKERGPHDDTDVVELHRGGAGGSDAASGDGS